MANELLSQEEIDALLNRSSSPTLIEQDLGDEEKDLLGEIGNICMGSAATTLSILINQTVSITTPKVTLTDLAHLRESFQIPIVGIEVSFTIGLEGINLLVLRLPDAGVIADLMMGGSGVYKGNPLSELEMSAVSEAMNQMIGSSATALATMLKRGVNISPPEAFVWGQKDQDLKSTIKDEESLVQVSFKIKVGSSLIDSEIMQLLPLDTAKSMIDAMMAGFKEPEAKSEPVKEVQVSPKIEPSAYEEIPAQRVEEQREEVGVHKAQFVPLHNELRETKPRNIDLILDVPIEISVILGKSKKSIKEILELDNGSLIELDKLVEEPVEVLVNGKLVAQGEVVVVNENFGVRITNIVSDVERVKNLSK